MNIGFSTFLLHGGQTGSATYIRELLRILQQEDEINNYDLLMARTDADLLPLVNPRFRQELLPAFLNNPLTNLVWHNTALAAAGRKYDLLHIPSARRIPLIKRTRVVATVHDLAAFSVEAKYGPARMAFNRTIVPAMIRRDRLTRRADVRVQLIQRPVRIDPQVVLQHLLPRPVAKQWPKRCRGDLHAVVMIGFVVFRNLQQRVSQLIQL